MLRQGIIIKEIGGQIAVGGSAFANADQAIGANIEGGEVGGLVAAFGVGAANGLHSGVVNSEGLKVVQLVGGGGKATNNGPVGFGGLLPLEGVVTHFTLPSAGGSVTSDVGHFKGCGLLADRAAGRDVGESGLGQEVAWSGSNCVKAAVAVALHRSAVHGLTIP